MYNPSYLYMYALSDIRPITLVLIHVLIQPENPMQGFYMIQDSRWCQDSWFQVNILLSAGLSGRVISQLVVEKYPIRNIALALPTGPMINWHWLSWANTCISILSLKNSVLRTHFNIPLSFDPSQHIQHIEGATQCLRLTSNSFKCLSFQLVYYHVIFKGLPCSLPTEYRFASSCTQCVWVLFHMSGLASCFQLDLVTVGLPSTEQILPTSTDFCRQLEPTIIFCICLRLLLSCCCLHWFHSWGDTVWLYRMPWPLW